MAFVTGLVLIDAPASALNNSGNDIPGARTENSVAVKFISTRSGSYPYVSAQAYRAWLRQSVDRVMAGTENWQSSPVFREEKVAYTDANPLIYWDDDLMGYMRAPSKKASAVAKREAGAEEWAKATPTDETVTRISPFRMSTLVSIAPVNITNDFGVMARQDGDPVPYEHQFYRATLQGLFSLDLHAAGTFTYRSKTGFRNLDGNRKQQAERMGLEHMEKDMAYRLPQDERLRRIKALFEGMAVLHGGAKLTLHYTDVSPVLSMLAVTHGGNHIFGHVIRASERGLPQLAVDALAEVFEVHQNDILSPVYIGWVRGYLDDERARLEQALSDGGELAQFADRVIVTHPRSAFRELISAFDRNPQWLD
jgi:CRISPR-associated protein Cst2